MHPRTMLNPRPLVVFLLLAAALPARAPAAQAADPIEGFWTGKVFAPQGEVADIGFDFQRERDGSLGFKFYFPAMFTHGASLGIPVEITGAGDYAITPAFAFKLHR